MIFSGPRGFGLSLAGVRGRAVFVAAAVAAISAAVATPSMAAPRVARSVRLAPRSQVSLSRAPAGLQMTVRRALGARVAGKVWSQQAKLKAADRGKRNFFGQ